MPLHACASQLAAYSTSRNVDLTLRHGFENLSPPNVSCPSPFPCPKGLLLVGGLWKKTVHTSSSTILTSETMSTDTFVLFFSRISATCLLIFILCVGQTATDYCHHTFAGSHSTLICLFLQVYLAQTLCSHISLSLFAWVAVLIFARKNKNRTKRPSQ